MKVGERLPVPDICVTLLGRRRAAKTFQSMAAAAKYMKILRRAGLRWRMTLTSPT